MNQAIFMIVNAVVSTSVVKAVKIDDKCITICRFVSTFIEQVRALNYDRF